MGVIVFDTSALSHFARAGHLDLLGGLVEAWDAKTTRAVLDEIREGARRYPALADVEPLEWLHEARLDGLAALGLFAEYAMRLGTGSKKHVGEATVLACCELTDATAIVDEHVGRQYGQERGVEVHGTLWLVSNGVRRGILPMKRATRLVDELRESGMFLPCNGDEFEPWATASGLLG